jgi:multidrug resistance efflux pump
MRSLEEIVAEGKRVAANRDQIEAAGRRLAADPAQSEAERAELRKHWKRAESRVRELQKEYVVTKQAVVKAGASVHELQAKYVEAKRAVPPGEPSVRDKEWALHGFRVATIRVAQEAQLPKNRRNKALYELAETMWRECHRYEAELKAAKEAK